MDVAALITWLVTAVGGFVMLGIWITKGGVRRPRPSRAGSRWRDLRPLPPRRGRARALDRVPHQRRSSGLAWAAFIVLIVVALLGFAMLARWLAGRPERGASISPVAGSDGGIPAEQHFPIPVVVVHGLVGAVTLVLVLIAALSI